MFDLQGFDHRGLSCFVSDRHEFGSLEFGHPVFLRLGFDSDLPVTLPDHPGFETGRLERRTDHLGFRFDLPGFETDRLEKQPGPLGFQLDLPDFEIDRLEMQPGPLGIGIVLNFHVPVLDILYCNIAEAEVELDNIYDYNNIFP